MDRNLCLSTTNRTHFQSSRKRDSSVNRNPSASHDLRPRRILDPVSHNPTLPKRTTWISVSIGGSIKKSIQRSSIPTPIPLFELDCDTSDKVSVVTTETFGVDIVAATRQEFLSRLKALTAARASGGKRVTKDECEELLYKIHAEQREKYVGGSSVEVDKSEEGDRSGAEAAKAEAVTEDAVKSKEVKTRRRSQMEKSSLRPKSLSESTCTVIRSNKSRKKEVRLFDESINWNGSMSQSGFTAKDEERGSSDNDSRQEELSQLIELKLQLAKQQELIDSLNAKLSSMSKVQERNSDLERENDVLWKKVMALQSASKNQSRSVTQSNDSIEQSASMNQCRSVVNKILSQSCGSSGTEETVPCSAAPDIQSLHSELFLPDSL
ncbi:hypothetical protein THAOC_15480 [Thalassiosira oceanica]|uniref:Uncharacterized protein n=1 Tax=Thalassiosira oceanica TaxID=159749 RepID=K0T056_THAOC|nr:hypothetical protein THAOC_15480 [Thalassiosira oceanica]|eukprot:EJK63842.1 hypothetical protein THAOC_15480 [Thalassiosira oceanica]